MPALKYENENVYYAESAGKSDDEMRRDFLGHLQDKLFPCVVAKAALGLQTIDVFTATHIACPFEDGSILQFLYDFVDRLRCQPAKYRSAVILFRDQTSLTESEFDHFMWKRLQALADLDRTRYKHDPRVSANPDEPNFSFSLKEEAFYIIGMHPGSSRKARRSPQMALVFNAHIQFETLRQEEKYAAVQQVIRRRDIAYSGSVNPMLRDFGDGSEAMQYSGKRHESGWACPLHLKAPSDEYYSPA